MQQRPSGAKDAERAPLECGCFPGGKWGDFLAPRFSNPGLTLMQGFSEAPMEFVVSAGCSNVHLELKTLVRHLLSVAASLVESGALFLRRDFEILALP